MGKGKNSALLWGLQKSCSSHDLFAYHNLPIVLGSTAVVAMDRPCSPGTSAATIAFVIVLCVYFTVRSI